MWVLAGPGITRSMADYGATVIRIESTSRVDPTRTVGPFKDNNTGAEYSALFGNNNAGKLGLSLDLTKPEAREIVLDLVRWADVVTESFSPKAMRAWGFDYESLRAVKPDIIMLSTCLMGQTGPLARFAGFGNLAAALCGFYNLVGWPDRSPSGPFSAYTDYIAPRFGLAAMMAALIHRKRTGQGQYIDQAQAESALQFLTLPILDTVASGRKYSPVANDDLEHAPHGVYPAAGEDRWVAIACRTDDHWRALCAAMGQPQLADDPRFGTFAARREHRAELDRVIGEWTRLRTPLETEQMLQASGVPAHTVQDSPRRQSRSATAPSRSFCARESRGSGRDLRRELALQTLAHPRRREPGLARDRTGQPVRLRKDSRLQRRSHQRTCRRRSVGVADGRSASSASPATMADRP